MLSRHARFSSSPSSGDSAGGVEAAITVAASGIDFLRHLVGGLKPAFLASYLQVRDSFTTESQVARTKPSSRPCFERLESYPETAAKSLDSLASRLEIAFDELR